MRKTVATAVALLALAAAGWFGSLRLSAHGNYPACVSHIPLGVWGGACAPASRAVWQFPVAVVIALAGAIAAVRLLKRT